jgi:hypothetical protein
MTKQEVIEICQTATKSHVEEIMQAFYAFNMIGLPYKQMIYRKSDHTLWLLRSDEAIAEYFGFFPKPITKVEFEYKAKKIYLHMIATNGGSMNWF